MRMISHPGFATRKDFSHAYPSSVGEGPAEFLLSSFRFGVRQARFPGTAHNTRTSFTLTVDNPSQFEPLLFRPVTSVRRSIDWTTTYGLNVAGTLNYARNLYASARAL